MEVGRPLSIIILFVILLNASLVLSRHSAHNEVNAKHLVVDHDGGADDAMAIFMAALDEEKFGGPKLTALTTTYGNVNEEQAFINSQVILDVADRRDVLLYRGSVSPLIEGIVSDHFFGLDGLGDNGVLQFKPTKVQRDHAVLGLLELSRKHKNNLIVVAIGPLTNIALAVKLDPGFLGRIGHLYIGGGNIKDETFKEAEFNVAMDPEAYAVVMKNTTPEKVTIIPYSTIIKYQTLTLDWRINVLGALDSSIMKHQNKFERVSLANSTDWVLLDPSAMAIVLNESDIVEEISEGVCNVGTCGSERGITSFEFYKTKDHFNKSKLRIVTKVKKEPYQEFLLRLFSKTRDRRQ